MYLMVVSSTATIPARAPASIAILQSVMRPSIDNPRIAEPANSIAYPLPPAVPVLPMMANATSLAVTVGFNWPSTKTCMALDFFCTKHWVAITCSTSDVPMP